VWQLPSEIVTDQVLVEARGPVRVITINRPGRKNALDIAAWDALRDALDDTAADPTVGCAVLTGAGDAFCAGVDLADFNDPTAYEGVDMDTQGYNGVMKALQCFDVPLVAAVNGVGVGFGMTVLPLCDLVLIAEGARLKVPFIDMGVTTEGAASFLLPVRVGWQEAARIIFTGDWVTSAEAVAMGLAWREVSPESLLDEALALADRIGAGNVDSLRTTKRLMMAARADAIEDARLRELGEFQRLVGRLMGR
jgi:enoyl-CoA hydratase/carnithine racemase